MTTVCREFDDVTSDGGTYSAPLAGLRGPTSKRRGRKGEGKEGKGRGKEGKGGQGKGGTPTVPTLTQIPRSTLAHYHP